MRPREIAAPAKIGSGDARRLPGVVVLAERHLDVAQDLRVIGDGRTMKNLPLSVPT